MIKRCIQLAYNGLGTTYPNPLVGCVIVHEGKIIGEGWHQKAGEPHAEVRAIASVKDKSLLAEVRSMWVWSLAVIMAKRPLVPIWLSPTAFRAWWLALPTPLPKVAGRGIEKLRAAGCEVTVGVMEKNVGLNKTLFYLSREKTPLYLPQMGRNRRWFYRSCSQRYACPRVDYRCLYAPRSTQNAQWRTSYISRRRHCISRQSSLDTRDWYGKNPLRVIIDPHLRSPKEFKVWNDQQPTLFITNKEDISDKKLWTTNRNNRHRLHPQCTSTNLWPALPAQYPKPYSRGRCIHPATIYQCRFIRRNAYLQKWSDFRRRCESSTNQLIYKLIIQWKTTDRRK